MSKMCQCAGDCGYAMCCRQPGRHRKRSSAAHNKCEPCRGGLGRDRVPGVRKRPAAEARNYMRSNFRYLIFDTTASQQLSLAAPRDETVNASQQSPPTVPSPSTPRSPHSGGAQEETPLHRIAQALESLARAHAQPSGSSTSTPRPNSNTLLEVPTMMQAW
eukprot:9948340-Karenia_brevis.AAC.1